MAISILDPLVDKAGGVKRSSNWYRKTVTSVADKVTARRLMRNGKLTGRPSLGRLNFFIYDAKTKAKLPYWDAFPLVIPIESIPGGFTGINFHYLPPLARFRLLEQLQRFAISNRVESSNRFDVSWNRVKGVRLIKGTVKRYLYSQVRSSFLRVDFDEAAFAVYLPVQQFRKGSPY